SAEALDAVMAAGGSLVALGVLVVVLDSLRALFGRGDHAADDPYDGLTLEWATTCPPPPANFDAIPEIRSAQPLADLRVAPGASGTAP
ncbi:MAG TPA: hypothetical protein VF954_03040, partial [Acidimicrobiales bacterium]